MILTRRWNGRHDDLAGKSGRGSQRDDDLHGATHKVSLQPISMICPKWRAEAWQKTSICRHAVALCCHPLSKWLSSSSSSSCFGPTPPPAWSHVEACNNRVRGE